MELVTLNARPRRRPRDGPGRLGHVHGGRSLADGGRSRGGSGVGRGSGQYFGEHQVSADDDERTKHNHFFRIVGAQFHDVAPGASFTKVSSFRLTVSIWPFCCGEATRLSMMR